MDYIIYLEDIEKFNVNECMEYFKKYDIGVNINKDLNIENDSGYIKVEVKLDGVSDKTYNTGFEIVADEFNFDETYEDEISHCKSQIVVTCNMQDSLEELIVKIFLEYFATKLDAFIYDTYEADYIQEYLTCSIQNDKEILLNAINSGEAILN